MEEEKEEVRQKNKHADTEKKSGMLKKTILGAVIFIVLVVIFTIVWYNISLSGTGTAEEEVKIEIAMGSGTSKVANILKENGIIRSKEAFKLYVKLNNVKSLQAGSYTLTKDMTVPQIVEALKTGKVFKDNQVKITFVSGKNFRYIANEIAKNTNNTEEDVYNTLEDEAYIDSLIQNYWFLTDEIKNENIYYAIEGYLFPDTYFFEDKDVKVQDIFKTLLDKMAKVLEEYKEDIQKSKYSVREILAMASIIENEGIFDKDRKDISSVLYNRLEKKMSLGSDVTTYYAFKIELGSRDLYKSEINTFNPYNTRGPNMAGKIPVRTNLFSR